MSYYHESKDAALLAGAVYAEHFDCKAELEAFNGWVLVLIPKSAEIFQWPLAPILQHAEIDLQGFGGRLSRRPASKRKPPPISAPRAAPPPPPPPPPPPVR